MNDLLRIRLIPLLLLTACAAPFWKCAPFFPETGEPIEVVSGRGTPKAVIAQLISAYTNRRIDLYEDLFPTDRSFRFYISPRLVETGTSNEVSVFSEQIDSTYLYVPRGTYYYWTYADEKSSHDLLFSKATSISFTQQPLYDESKYAWRVSESGDTVAVEVLMEGGEIRISAIDRNNSLITNEFTIPIERQVFYMERDSERNWVIKRWFDFGMTG